MFEQESMLVHKGLEFAPRASHLPVIEPQMRGRFRVKIVRHLFPHLVAVEDERLFERLLRLQLNWSYPYLHLFL